jgi:translation initiation factor 2B subunit (eIF-2B alpha/beta/delta family)
VAGFVVPLRQFTISRIDETISESLQAVAQIVLHAREIVASGDKIMTHSYSSTVVLLLKDIASRDGNLDIIITRSGAGRTGEQIVWELSDCGVPITFIDDAAVGLYLSTVNKVLLGADTVGADGVVNGVGSYPLAVVAARHGVPVYILAETLKFDTSLVRDRVDIEDRDGAELAAPINLPQTISVGNPHFDITPLELITGVMTERGIMTPADVIAFLNG